MKSRLLGVLVVLTLGGCFDEKKEEAPERLSIETQYTLCHANAAVDADVAAERMGLTVAELKCVSVTWSSRCISRRFHEKYQKPLPEESRQALNAIISRECLVGGGRTQRVADLLDTERQP